MKIKITLTEEMLGTASNNKDLHREFIASKSPDAATLEEEVAAVGAEAVEKKEMTVFGREDGRPFIYDYQVKGFLKEAASFMVKVPDSLTLKNKKAYRKNLTGLVFVFPRKIILDAKAIGNCQRPLRADTAQGPRVCLANSETVPAGTTFELEIRLLDPGHESWMRELLDYGALYGLQQWRSSGKGRFTWTEL